MYYLWFTTFLIVPALVFSQGRTTPNALHEASPTTEPTGDLSIRVDQLKPEAMETAIYNLREKRKMELEMANNPSNTSDKAFKLVQCLQKGNTVVQQLGMHGFFMENYTHELIKLLGMKADMAMMDKLGALTSPLRPNPHTLKSDEKTPNVEIGTCPYTNYICSEEMYRSFDGSCNNLQNPLWGRAMTPHRRYLPADYYDGIEEMRRAKDGSELPSARLVSSSIHINKNKPDPMHTLMLMQWGQFIAYDFTQTALTKLPKDLDGTEKTVDVECGQNDCGIDDPFCKPIAVPANDTVFGSTKSCLTFVRTQGVPIRSCLIAPREQLNQLTHYIDGSNVYGSSKEQADTLRDLTDENRGRMRVSDNPNTNLKELLPTSTEDHKCLKRQPTWYEAGDERVNQQTSLTSLHIVWIREHNRLEAQLHQLNPSWDGERLYQECRKIVGALIQQITYREYLTVVLGPIVMEKYGLDLLQDGFYTGYDPSVDASTSNIFATAAFRFGHSQIPPMMKTFDKDYKIIRTLQFSELYLEPSHLINATNDGVDGFLRGVCTSGVQQADQCMTEEVTSKLFSEAPPEGLGTDLASINIQRSRDHGIPGYNAWRTFCGLNRTDKFEELVEMDVQSRETFKKLYKFVDDIDIFPAGLAETPVEGSLLGPTFSCILGRQFERFRKGDRFWYENSGQFSAAQLKEIRKVNLSKIICENGDDISQIQPAVFENPFREAYPNKDNFTSAPDGLKVEDGQKLWDDDYNQRKNCSSLSGMDLTQFKD